MLDGGYSVLQEKVAHALEITQTPKILHVYASYSDTQSKTETSAQLCFVPLRFNIIKVKWLQFPFLGEV